MNAGYGYTENGGLNWQTGLITGYRGLIFRTVDGGLHWELQESGTQSNLLSISFLDDHIGAIAGGGVVLHTFDGGQSWIYNRQFKPTKNGIMAAAVLDTNVVMVLGKYGTILQTTTPVVSAVNEKLSFQPKNLLKPFILQQNYPNPFNSSTTIPFSLFEPALVVLKIFNISGELVTNLIAKELPAGNYNIPWKINSEPSGIYFYQIEAGKFIECKKLLLIR